MEKARNENQLFLPHMMQSMNEQFTELKAQRNAFPREGTSCLTGVATKAEEIPVADTPPNMLTMVGYQSFYLRKKKALFSKVMMWKDAYEVWTITFRSARFPTLKDSR